jgi:hypothetical protein
MASAANRVDYAIGDWSGNVGRETVSVIVGEESIARIRILNSKGKADEGIDVGAAVL